MVMDVASYIKSMLKTDSVCIDNFVFRLHYRVTVAILLASSIIGRQGPFCLENLKSEYPPCDCQGWPSSTSGTPSTARRAPAWRARCWTTTAGYTQPSTSDRSTRSTPGSHYTNLTFPISMAFTIAITGGLWQLYIVMRHYWGRCPAVIKDNCSPLSDQNSPSQGYVGCLLDPELVQEKLLYSGGAGLYYNTVAQSAPQLTDRTLWDNWGGQHSQPLFTVYLICARGYNMGGWGVL